MDRKGADWTPFLHLLVYPLIAVMAHNTTPKQFIKKGDFYLKHDRIAVVACLLYIRPCKKIYHWSWKLWIFKGCRHECCNIGIFVVPFSQSFFVAYYLIRRHTALFHAPFVEGYNYFWYSLWWHIGRNCLFSVYTARL